MQSLHPSQQDFQAALSEVIPQSLASFLFGLGAASASIWDQGGLMVEEVASGQSVKWLPNQASPREELLEFFACVCGNRSDERHYEAEPALAAFERAVQ
ncbi:MAG: hypothetical protein V4772_00700 [Pseudomonadota bacterium]